MKQTTHLSSLRMTAMPALAAFLTVSLALAFKQPGSAATKERRNSHDWYTALERVPERARAKQNPLESDPDTLAAGGKLFKQHCAECHGMKAEGTKRGPSLLKEQVQQATPGAIFWILTNGVVRHGMPDWSSLPEPERWQIVTFLKFLGADGASKSPGASAHSAHLPHSAR